MGQGRDPRNLGEPKRDRAAHRPMRTVFIDGRAVEKPMRARGRGERVFSDAELLKLQETGRGTTALKFYRTDRLRLAYLNAVAPLEGPSYTDKLFLAASALSAPGINIDAEQRRTLITVAGWLHRAFTEALLNEHSFVKAGQELSFVTRFALFINAFVQVLQLTHTDRYQIENADERRSLLEEVSKAIDLLREPGDRVPD